MAPSPPPTSWALLDRFPQFHKSGDGVTVDVRAPPATSSVLLDGSIPQGRPYIVAADKAGAILLAFIKPGPGAPPDLAVLTLDKGAPTLRALPPRQPPVHPIARIHAIGLLPTRSSTSAHVEYVVAELQTAPDREGARLITINTEGGDWAEKEFAFPASHAHRPWGRDGVLSHAGSLWWSDLSWGLIGCDPLASTPIMAFVELPAGSGLTFVEHPAVEGRRLVADSESRIYYMEINRVRDGASRMAVWALSASSHGTGWEWTFSRRVHFGDIWQGESYARTRLPARVPTFTALSPIDPSMVCFRVEGYLVGVHLSSNRVLWVSEHVLGEYLAWAIPRCITTVRGLACGAVGNLSVRGFQCRFFAINQFSTLMLIERFRPHAEFAIKLWHKKYAIKCLELVEQYGGSGSIIYSPNADTTAPVIVRTLRHYVLFAPIPDIKFIFDLLQIPTDARVQRDSIAEDFQPNGRTRITGSFADDASKVLFRVHEGTPGPILMLECYLGPMECFGIQLLNYLEFHSLTIERSSRGINTVSLKLLEGSPEQKMSTTDFVFSYTPIPYLAKIASHSR